MRTERMMLALAAALLATVVGAEVSAVSDEAPLDTRSLSRVTAVDDTLLDSRSYTADWSEEGTLNTKRIMGTMIRLM